MGTRKISMWLAVGMMAAAAPVAAQVSWIVGGDSDRCESGGRNERHCELRRATLSAVPRLELDGGGNGGVRVEGSERSDIEIVARVWASARTAERANELASDVELRADGARLTADGPAWSIRESWGVSWELSVPRVTDLALRTRNGRIAIADMVGDIGFDTRNGGVRLEGLAGDVHGRTINGALHIELTGSTWEGRGLDVETTNGAVTLLVPEGYGAELETGTVRGDIDVDFPITVRGRIGRKLRTRLGEGGAPLRAVTTNGKVRISRR